MGRNSKFSFPLPGKKRSHLGPDASREEQQLSKAEKILGTSGLVASSSSTYTSRLIKLRSHPSYQAFAGEHTDTNDTQSSFRDQNMMAQPRYATVEKFSDTHGSAKNDDGGTQSSFTSSSRTWALRNCSSSSTLKSFYDPEKHPLPISQQTSESAIRDMALRKGKPIVIGRKPSTGRRNHDELETSCTASTESRSTTTTTKRPPRLDLSRLFQRPSTSTLTVGSPDPSLLAESPSARSHTSVQQSPHIGHDAGNDMKSPMTFHGGNALKSPASSNAPSRILSPLLKSGSKLLKRRTSTSSSIKMAYQNRFMSHECQEIKQNIYRPPQGAKNWFDGLLEEEDEFDEEMETEASTPTTGILSYRDHESQTPIESEYPVVIDHFHPPLVNHFNPPVLKHLNPTESLPGFKNHRGTLQRESRHEIDKISSRSSTLTSPRTPVSPMSLPPPTSTTMSLISPTSSRTRHSTMTRESLLANSDLGDTSILSLSSSDGESENGDSIDFQLPRFHKSIQISEIDSIVIAKAQAFRTSASKSSKITEEALQRWRTSVASTGSILSTSTTAKTSSLHSSMTGPTHLAVPPRGARPRRSGHTRQPSSIPEDHDEPSPPLSPTTTSPSSNRNSIPAGPEPVKSEPRKMMAVTEEEETLLEMMRSKRAVMAKHGLNNQNCEAKQSIGSLASSSSRSTRANRPTSTSSSILDSFPICRSQRSSLMTATFNSNSESDLSNAATASACTSTRADSTSRQRSGSTQSQATQHSKRTSTTSSISSRLEHSCPAFPPPCSLADVNLNLIPSPTYSRAAHEARSPSPETSSSPSTPQTRRGSADVIIRPTASPRNSFASFSHLANAIEHNTLASEEAETKTDKSFNNKTTRGHSRRRTASSNMNILLDSESEEDKFSNGDSVDPALVRRNNRLSLTGKISSRNSNSPTVCATTAVQVENLGYVWEQNGDEIGLGFAKSVVEKVGHSARSRCSVNEDVLAAWGSLGGWRDIRA